MPKFKGVAKKRKKWYCYINSKSKLHWFGGYDTAEEAHRARQKLVREYAEFNLIPSKVTFQEFAVKYLEEYELLNCRKSTAQKTEGILRLHILPEIGDMRLRDIRPYQLVELKNKVMREKTPAVANNTMRILRKVLNKAVEWEYLQYSPLKTKMPPAPDTEHSVLTPEELFTLVESLERRDKYIVALAGYVGLRRGEIFGLQWKDFDFNRHTLSLQRQHVNGEITYLKTDESKCVLPIWPKLSKIMKEWKLQSQSFKWVFLGRQGQPMSAECWGSKEWPRIRKAFSLPSDLHIGRIKLQEGLM